MALRNDRGQFVRLSNADLIGVDITQMTDKQLREYMRRLVKIANRRLDRLGDLPTPPPSFWRTTSQLPGGRFGTRGKNRGQLYNEFSQIKDFLRSGTSTVSEAKSWWKQWEGMQSGTPEEVAKRRQEMTDEWQRDPQGLIEFGYYRDSLGSQTRKEIYDEGKDMGLHGDAWVVYSQQRAKEEYERQAREDYYANQARKTGTGAGSAGGAFGSSLRFNAADLP